PGEQTFYVMLGRGDEEMPLGPQSVDVRIEPRRRHPHRGRHLQKAAGFEERADASVEPRALYEARRDARPGEPGELAGPRRGRRRSAANDVRFAERASLPGAVDFD